MKTIRILLVAALALVLLTGVLTTGAQDNNVTMIVTRDPVSLDPQSTLDPGAPILLAYIYDTLVYQAEDGRILPSLAESWTVADDNTALTFKLKPGVVFSDGAPVDADAVVYTFQRLQQIGQRSLIYNDIMNVSAFEKLDDLSVRFHLIQPSATLLSALTYPYAGILNPAAVEAAGEAYGQQPVGSGPFVLESWIPENTLTFVPNPLYSGHRPWTEAQTPPAIDRLTVVFSTDESARASALLANEADIAYFASGSQVSRFAGSEDFRILESPGRALNFLVFNTARAPFDNAAVRRAIGQIVNREDMLLLAADGVGEIVNGPLPPTIFGYNPEIDASAANYDPEAAAATLAENGISPDHPVTISILTSTFPTFSAIATILQAELADVGINAEINVLDFSAVREVAVAGDYDILITRYDWNDPDVLWRYLGTANQGATNRYFYGNPDLDALLLQGQTAFDPDARFDIYAEAQRMILDDAPIIALYMPVTDVVVSNRVQDVSLLHSHVVLEDATLTP